MVIDESSAFGVLQALPTLDDARRERAARLLRDYQGQQERLGQPLWPSRMAAMEQSRERVRTIFDNPLTLDAEDGTFAAADAAAPGTGDRMRKREANILWLSNRYQADEADVRARYDFYKADAGAKWGTGTLDDEAFFSKAKGEVDQERATETRRMTIAQQAAQAAIAGGSFLDAMQTSGAKDDADKRVFRESFGRVSKKLAPYRLLIQEVATDARRMMTSGEGADWSALAERLLTVPKEDRALVLDALGRMEGEQVEGGAGKTLAHAFARGLEDLIARTQGGASGALRRQLQGRVEFAAGMGEMVGLAPEETGQTLQELERFNERQDDLRELAQDARAIAAGTLAPLQDVRVLGMNLTGAAENLPLTATAFVPMLGPAAMVAFFQDATDEELRREYPDMDRAERQKVATLAAPIQAATEVISDRLLFGRLPNLKRAFSSPALTASSVSKQIAGRLALGTATETAEELAQGITSRAVMEIQQALGADVPDVDWGGYFQRFGDDLPELVSTIVPLALLGAGVGQVSDYQNAKALVNNETLLKAAGYENAADIKAAADAGQWRQVETLMREQWAKVAPKGQTVGEVAAAASETVIKQQTENVKAATEEVRKLREQNAEAKRMLDDAERRRLIPSIRRDSQGWSVADPNTGAILRVNSRDDAVAMAYEHLNEMERQSAVAMAQVADEFMGLRPGAAEAFEISTQARSLGQEVQAGRVTEEQGAEAVELYGLMHGLQPGEARAETIAVLGNNKAEEIEGIRTAVSRIWGGGNLITVMHEGIHGRWRAGLERGHYSQALGVQWVRMAERASGQQFLPVRTDAEVTPEMLEEAIVEVATADLIGRRKDAKQHFTPGLISRGVASYALSQRAEAKAAGRFVTWLQGWKSFWGRVLRNAKALKKARAEGKLNPDFDALLDDLLGTEPQQRFEAAAAQEAVDMAGEAGNVPFSIGPKSNTLDDVVNQIESAGVEMFASEKSGIIRLSKIIVPKEKRNKGIGTQAMQSLIGYADATNQQIALTPSSDFGGSKARLEKFYRRFGFRVYKGYAVQEKLIRDPAGSAFSLAPGYGIKHRPRDDGPRAFDLAEDDMMPADVYQHPEWYSAMEPRVIRETMDQIRKVKGKPKGMVTIYRAGPKGEMNQGDWVSLSKTYAASHAMSQDPGAYKVWSAQVAAEDVRWSMDDLSEFGYFGERVEAQDTGARFSLAPRTAQDSDYLAAVEAGDMATAQRMVDEAARAAGYGTRAYHGTSGDWSVFDLAKIGTIQRQDFGKGIYLAPENRRADAEMYARQASQATGLQPKVLSLWVKTGRELVGANYAEEGSNLTGAARERGYDSVVVRYDRGEDRIGQVSEIIVLSPDQIKSADPVTYDDAGNVIPLSQRFTPSDDIRFSLAPRSLASVADTILAAQMRKPEFREALLKEARRRLDAIRQDGPLRVDGRGRVWQRRGQDSRADAIRSAANIEAERKFRFRSRQRELLEAGMAELSPAELLAYEKGTSQWRDNDRLRAIFENGRLMSKTVATKRGSYDPAKHGDYDAAPGWLPPAMYANDGGLMPDQMAQLAFDGGLISEPSPDALWEAIKRELDTLTKDNEAARAAQQKVREAEKSAAKQAKDEADAWAKEEKAKVPTPKERQLAALRTLDAILSAFPPEIRGQVGGFVKLASLGTDKAREAEIAKRLDKLDAVVEKAAKKHYLERIEKDFKRFGFKKDDKGRITSNVTAEAAADIGFAYDFAQMDDANQEKELASLEKTLEESEDAAELQDAIGKLAIAQLFHKLESRDSAEMEAAASWLNEIGTGAREARKVIDEARAQWVKEAKGAAKKDAANGKLSSLPDAENVEADVRSSTFKRFTNDVKGFLNSALFTMGQQLEIVFGQSSRITQEFHKRGVRAANEATDIKRDIEARRAAFVAQLFGTESRIKQAGRMGALTVPTASGVRIVTGAKTQTVEVPAQVVQRFIEGQADPKAFNLSADEVARLADAWGINESLPGNRRKSVLTIERTSGGNEVELTMSQDEGIQYFLWSKQKASREQMERDGWTEESFQQLDAFLSDDAKALAGFFADEYARLGQLIDPVYRRMFNAPFPQVRNYSPIFRDISRADSIIDIDQQGHGSGVSSGFILARNKNARSAMRRTSAISAFMQHAQSAAHWISHVELVRDLRSVLTDKEVQNAIRANGRTAAANGIKKRVLQLENQGKIGAAGIAELDSWGSRLLQARAFKGLAWRISPVIKQTSAFFNPLLADVPAWDYMRGTARLLSGKLDVSAMWNRPEIQRRIVMGFSAEARIAMDKLGYTGSTLIAAMGKGMLPMQLVDAGWTTAGAAIAFDFYRRNNIKSGMNETQAESAALDQLEMMIAEAAQPADAVNRSLIEGLQNPWLKAMWMFASESRKTLAVEIMALRRLATGKSKNKAMDVQRAVVAHVVMATTTQLMAGLLSLIMGDDDDREREWSLEEWAAAIAAGPINGLFLFGDALNYVGRRLFGLHAFEPSTAIGQAVKTVSYAPANLDKVINGDPEEQRKAFLRLGEAFGQAAAIVGPGNPFTAADVILGNPLKDADKILTRMTD